MSRCTADHDVAGRVHRQRFRVTAEGRSAPYLRAGGARELHYPKRCSRRDNVARRVHDHGIGRVGSVAERPEIAPALRAAITGEPDNFEPATEVEGATCESARDYVAVGHQSNRVSSSARDGLPGPGSSEPEPEYAGEADPDDEHCGFRCLVHGRPRE